VCPWRDCEVAEASGWRRARFLVAESGECPLPGAASEFLLHSGPAPLHCGGKRREACGEHRLRAGSLRSLRQVSGLKGRLVRPLPAWALTERVQAFLRRDRRFLEPAELHPEEAVYLRQVGNRDCPVSIVSTQLSLTP
jgi:hypothetical protein